MAELTIDMTYGSALFQAATEVGKVDVILDETKQVLKLFEKEDAFRGFFNDPTVSANNKKDVLKNVFDGRVSKEVLNLLCVLVDKGRAARYPNIIDAFQKLADEATGYAKGVIYSVTPLTEEQKSKFESQSQKLLGAKVVLENRLEPSLIGGVRILIDGKIIDASIKKRLDDLASTLI